MPRRMISAGPQADALAEAVQAVRYAAKGLDPDLIDVVLEHCDAIDAAVTMPIAVIHPKGPDGRV